MIKGRPFLKRLLYLFFVLWGVSLGTFGLLEMAPGDPAEIILRDRTEAPGREQIEALRQEMDLDAPVSLRYLRWIGGLATGDWGTSWRSGRPVLEEVFDRLPATCTLAAAAFLLVLAIATGSGVVSALWHGRAPDHWIRAATILASAVPSYWLGLVLIYGFSLRLGLLPVAGQGSVAHLVLPSLTLALSVALLQGQVLRAALVQAMSSDWVRFAFAKGMKPRNVFFRHTLRAALSPMATLWAVSLGQLLGGAVIVESIFAWPGIGRLTVEAVIGRDIPVVQAIVLLLAAVFVLANQLAEIIQHRLDPKLRFRP
jgi:ABC-type dipeptide/oligopeptide/nickel transport system permease component